MKGRNVMFKDDNGKEILTKESIRDKMMQREKVRLAVIPIIFLLLLFVWGLGISTNLPEPYYAFMGIISVCAIVGSYSVIKKVVILTRLAFTIDEDSVFIKKHSNILAHRNSRKYDSSRIIGFCKYGWVHVSINTYSYTTVGDEFYLVVVGTKKKKAIWGYNKRFYDYKG